MGEGGLSQLFPLFFRFIKKMKYLENRLSKLRTIFIFEFLALRYLKTRSHVDRF
jgi:hypothetical protein